MKLKHSLHKVKLHDIAAVIPDFVLFLLDDKKQIVRVEGDPKWIKHLPSDWNTSILSIVASKDERMVQDALAKAYTGSVQTVHYRINLLSKGELYVNSTFYPLYEDNRVIGVIGLTSEFAEQKELDEEYEKVKMIFSTFISQSADMVILIDEEGKILNNPFTLEQLQKFPLQIANRESFFQYVAPNDHQILKQVCHDMKNNVYDETQFELKVYDAHQQLKTTHCFATNFLETPNMNGILLYLQDQSLLKQKDDEIEVLSSIDCLTNLNNRRHLEHQLEHYIMFNTMKQSTFALILLDIRNFHFINSTLGHRVGDLVLKKIAFLLKKHLNPYTSVIARTSGDEFALITHSFQNKENLTRVTDRIIELFRQPIELNDLNINLEITLGISFFEDESTKGEELFNNAQLSLFLAKKENQPYKVYSPTMSIESYKMVATKQHLQRAIEEGEIFLQYQPIYHLGSKKPMGVETLVRWQHPELGIVTPNDFIPLAEESGMIIPLGEHIFEEMCKMYSTFNEANVELQLFYNLSPVQLLSERLISFLKDVTQRYQLHPSQITLEITETIQIPNVKVFIDTVQKLQQLGFRFALDDFGTGYSSFTLLHHLKPDYIKVDRSIVQNIAHNDVNDAIIESLVKMGTRLNIEIIAEGVETKEEAAVLKKLDIDYVQGYYYMQPVISKKLFQAFQNTYEELPPVHSTRTERRRYFRVTPKQHIVASMTIDEINGKKVRLGQTKVLIQNIGPGGLLCLSDIKIPHNPSIILKLTTVILGEECVWYGKIVRMNTRDGLNEYGIAFVTNSKERNEYIRLFHQLQVIVANNAIIPDTPTYSEPITQFFN